jgi:hypothetical protein
MKQVKFSQGKKLKEKQKCGGSNLKVAQVK